MMNYLVSMDATPKSILWSGSKRIGSRRDMMKDLELVKNKHTLTC